MPSAIETLHPDVYVIETAGQPRVAGVSVNTAGFVGISEKGPVDRPVLITNYDQYVSAFGEYFRGSYLEPAIRYYFTQGGGRAYVVRAVGVGAADAWLNAKNVGESGGPAVVSSVSGSFNVEPGEQIDIEVSGYGLQSFIFSGTQAYTIGNGFTGNDINGMTLTIQFSGWDKKTITFSGLPVSPTVQDVADYLNPLIQGGVCIVSGSNIDFKADQRGNGSFIDITGGTALGNLGHTVFKTYGTGNVPNIDDVTAIDAATALAALQGAYPVAYNNVLQLITVERGTLVNIQVANTTTATAFGFDNVVHTGWGSSGSPAVLISNNVETFNLEPNEVLAVDVSNVPTQTITFLATQAVLSGSGFTGVALNSTTIQVQFAGYDATTITFSGMPGTATASQVVNFLNERIWGGSASVVGGEIVLAADQYGSGSFVQILGGSALPILGLVIGGSLGSGNVSHIDKVTAQEVIDLVNTTFTDMVASASTSNQVILTTVATGDTATIQVNSTFTTATGIGFPNTISQGSDADYMDAIRFEVSNPGAWGNSVAIRTIAWQQEIRAEVANTDTEIEVSSVRGMAIGDVFYVYDPSFTSKRFVGVITSINVAERKISVLPMVGDLFGIIPSGSPIVSSSQHHLNTTSMEELIDGQTSLTIRSSFGLRVGARVIITDGNQIVDVAVTSIEDTVINFAPVSLTTPLLSGSNVVSQEFKLQILEKGQIVETHDYLSMEEESEDYFGIRLGGDTNGSLYVNATDLYASPDDYWRKLPLPVFTQSMKYGLDGATPTDDDIIGDLSDPKTGLYLFDSLFDVNFIAAPGITTVTVQSEFSAFCEKKGTIMFIADAPKWADQATEIYNYRMFDLNLDSSQTALYYPWVVVRNPSVGNTRMAIPPSGHIAGEYAATAATRGVHVAPANVPMRGVVDLMHEVTDGEQDILNPVGVNCIRRFPGEGIRIWGTRTLFSVPDGRHYVPVRRLLNFIKESVRRGNRWAVFQPNNERLWGLITDVNTEFLHSLWDRGMLFPSSDESRAYFVKCDEETNPLSERKAGRVNCEFGVNPPLPAEFAIFRIGLWDGGSSIQEEVSRRG